MGIKVNVTDQNNVSVSVIPQARQTIQVTTPPNQVIKIDRGIIGPQGPPGPQGPSGNNNIGGYPVVVSGLNYQDVLMFGYNEWINNPQTEISDGGNF